jgi:hypothetical protein
VLLPLPLPPQAWPLWSSRSATRSKKPIKNDTAEMRCHFYAPKDKENLPGFDPDRFGMKD